MSLHNEYALGQCTLELDLFSLTFTFMVAFGCQSCHLLCLSYLSAETKIYRTDLLLIQIIASFNFHGLYIAITAASKKKK